MLSSVMVKLESSSEMTCCFVSGSYPRFVTSDDDGVEGGFILGLFLEVSADSNAVFLFDHCLSALVQILLPCAAC